MNLDDINPVTGAIPEPLSPLEGTQTDSFSADTLPLGLDDIAQDSSVNPVASEPEGETEPMSNGQLVGLIGFFTSMGLPPEAAAGYIAELESNSMLAMFLPILDLPDALAKYGVGNGSGKMPEWMRLGLGALLIGYTVYTTRGKYAAQGQGGAGLGGFGSGVPGPISEPEAKPPEPEIQSFFS
jgi:hypothetical protein